MSPFALRIYSPGVVCGSSTAATTTYDAEGNQLLTAADANGTYTNSYDVLEPPGQPVSSSPKFWPSNA